MIYLYFLEKQQNKCTPTTLSAVKNQYQHSIKNKNLKCDSELKVGLKIYNIVKHFLSTQYIFNKI